MTAETIKLSQKFQREFVGTMKMYKNLKNVLHYVIPYSLQCMFESFMPMRTKKNIDRYSNLIV